MEFYIIILIVLFALAFSDLIVGVANDAVNFLNSAVGSKAAPRRVILAIAAIGIIAGTMFSGGMMEVARKGIFNPHMFTLYDVMMIFLAVMFTDVLLLDLYNTFGLPTSTTVSLVFELLGAAVAVSLIKIGADVSSKLSLGNFINSSRAFEIITGIFISVGIAFTFGTVIQFITRLIFTFKYKKRLKYYGAVFSSIAITVILYFIVIKGLKGTVFSSSDMLEFVNNNTVLLLITSLLFFFLLFQVLASFTKINILVPVVLFGTMGLALAFAANDLVNFVGVAAAGLNSYEIAVQTSDPANTLMGQLAEPVHANILILVISGVVMSATLWYSKKAKKVTKTEVDLGRQLKGEERWGTSRVARSIIKINLFLFEIYKWIAPLSVRHWIDKRFKHKDNFDHHKHESDRPSFDLIRATVNLFVASSLISFGTSLKLPLSTTYVTFMVAMGTSFADRAWGRESAEYRVNGVLTVIGGWLFTALLAFTVAFVFGLLLHLSGMIAVFLLIVVSIFFVYRTHKAFTKKT